MRHCDYCRSSIVEGQRWVRQKIYNPHPDGQGARYRHYHAEPFVGERESCWEKQSMERETATRGRSLVPRISSSVFPHSPSPDVVITPLRTAIPDG
jgi:hypothetical protein